MAFDNKGHNNQANYLRSYAGKFVKQTPGAGSTKPGDYGLLAKDSWHIKPAQRRLVLEPGTREQLCQMLRTVIEEWGKENVYVALPAIWQSLGITRLGSVPVYYTTARAVVIAVETSNTNFQYTLELQEA
jgi:hypothetical protein